MNMRKERDSAKENGTHFYKKIFLYKKSLNLTNLNFWDKKNSFNRL